MATQVNIVAKLAASGEYIFSLALAPEPQIERRGQIDRGAKAEDKSPTDRVLPMGSSTIAPGMSVVIAL